MSNLRIPGDVFGHPVYMDDTMEPPWQATNRLVPKDEEGNSQPDADHPCPHCGKLPGPSGHDPCIDQLEGVSFACCGHGNPSQAYVAFDEDEFGNRKIIRDQEAIEYFRLVK
jgi:predicted RNA-binding Zn-ribbon protein involved in translation (DUF1610 family)